MPLLLPLKPLVQGEAELQARMEELEQQEEQECKTEEEAEVVCLAAEKEQVQVAEVKAACKAVKKVKQKAVEGKRKAAEEVEVTGAGPSKKPRVEHGSSEGSVVLTEAEAPLVEMAM
jgi:ParB-like chromosome segregation protein Spo0J